MKSIILLILILITILLNTPIIYKHKINQNNNYQTYKPKNFSIIKQETINYHVEITIYSQRKNYKVYIYPNLRIKNEKELEINKNIDDFLITLDKFIYITQEKKVNSFKSIYMFDFNKLYVK